MKRRLTEAGIPSLRTSLPQEDIFHLPTPGAGLRLTRESAGWRCCRNLAPFLTTKRFQKRAYA
jgi:hypothetical protein